MLLIMKRIENHENIVNKHLISSSIKRQIIRIKRSCNTQAGTRMESTNITT